MSTIEAKQAAERVELPATEGPETLLDLGLRYCAGREVPLDMIEAHKWFNIAALRGNDAAKQYRQEISREMSRADIGQAQRRAREWLALH